MSDETNTQNESSVKGEVGMVGTGMYSDYHKCKVPLSSGKPCGQAITHPNDGSKKLWACNTHWIQELQERKAASSKDRKPA